MKKTKKMKNLQLKATTVQQLTKDLTKVAGGWGRAPEETRQVTCSCGGACGIQESDGCP